MLQPHHQALVFDCDGTLADSMPVHWVAWSAVLEKHRLGHLFPHERFLSFGGRPSVKIIEQLAEEAGVDVDAPAIAAEKRAAYLERIGEVVTIEPILAVAREHRGKLPMAVATGSGRFPASRTLEAIGVNGWFDAVVTADDVTHPKPHPETFLKAAEALGVAPEHCLAFEDAEPGLQSARAAGMDVIDVRDVLADSSAA